MKIQRTLLLFFILCAFLCLQGFSRDAIRFSEPEKGIYVVEIDSHYFHKNSSVYLSDTLETVDDVAKKEGVKVAINGGFFDPNNEKTTSFVVVDGKITANPRENESLMENPELPPYMDKILNRSEFRVLQCGRQKKFDISQHFAPVEEGCRIKYSLQAGPELMPTLKLNEELFTLEKNGKVVRQSASALGRYARSAIGLKSNKVYLIAVSDEAGMTIPELSELVKRLDMEKALAFDGGSSTSLYVNLPQKKFSLISMGEGVGRRVKTILLVN